MKDLFESYSVFSIIVYAVGTVVLISLTGNPLFQTAYLFSIWLFIRVIDKQKAGSLISMSLFIGIPIFIINPIVNQRGMTIIFRLTEIPFIDRFTLTFESLVFSFVLMMKLINTIMIISIFFIIINPDRLVNFISAFAPRSALTVSIASKMIPEMVHRTTDIEKALKTRGADLGQKGLKKRIKNAWPFTKILLYVSLEDSWKTAEALESKGYGLKKRTIYNKEKFNARDMELIAVSMFYFLIALHPILRAFISFKFFPAVNINNVIDMQALPVVLSCVIIILFPIFLGWGRLNEKL